MNRSRPATSWLHAALGLWAALVCFMSASGARAANPESWVSLLYGNDSNACTQAAPCLTFQAAYNNTAANGQIKCLDSGDFGPVTIKVAMTIDCEGTDATIGLAASGTAITVMPSSGAATVTIRGLTLNGAGLGTDGVLIYGGQVVLEKIFATGFTNSCLNSPGASTVTLVVRDSNLSLCGNNALIIVPSGGDYYANIANTQINGSAQGAYINGGSTSGTIRMDMKNTVVSNNAYGVYASTSGANRVRLFVDDSSVTGNRYGLTADGANATILVRNSTITGNATGLQSVNSGKLNSYGNNSLNANITADGAFTGLIGQQ